MSRLLNLTLATLTTDYYWHRKKQSAIRPSVGHLNTSSLFHVVDSLSFATYNYYSYKTKFWFLSLHPPQNYQYDLWFYSEFSGFYKVYYYIQWCLGVKADNPQRANFDQKSKLFSRKSFATKIWRITQTPNRAVQNPIVPSPGQVNIMFGQTGMYSIQD